MASPKKIINAVALLAETTTETVEAFISSQVMKGKTDKWTKTGILKAFERPDSPVGKLLLEDKNGTDPK